MNRDDIRILRGILCISQDELARKVGTHRQMISNFETGVRPIPIKYKMALMGYFLIEAETNKILAAVIKESELVSRMRE